MPTGLARMEWDVMTLSHHSGQSFCGLPRGSAALGCLWVSARGWFWGVYRLWTPQKLWRGQEPRPLGLGVLWRVNVLHGH